METGSPKFCILIVDDDDTIIGLLRKLFSNENYRVYTASNGREALKLLREIRADAVLLDYMMPNMNGLELLGEIKEKFPDIACLMMTSHGEIGLAVEAMKQGAVDFVEKPFCMEGLLARVAQLQRIWELKKENRTLRHKLETRFNFDQFVGRSTNILQVKDLIARVAPSEATVLVQGETGTGKELAARAIHQHSARSHKAFVPVDCASISETVIESELFGHVKGAYTGAHADSLGLIRSADKGTLFLDEIGELSAAAQAKLLRSIQEKTVRPVGSNKSYKVDIRVVAATNKDLEDAVQQGSFRKDLFFRVNVMTISLPPLKDRKEDLESLADHFLKEISNQPDVIKSLSPETIQYLCNYNWPGNVRELANVIERAVAVCQGDVILPKDLPENIYGITNRVSRTKWASFRDNSLRAYEIEAIENALLMSANKRSTAAQILGIGEATLYRKLNRYHITST
jgi:DNA-binding NtrC family response regulator